VDTVGVSPKSTAKPGVDPRQRILDAALKRNQFRQDALIEILHTAQNLYGYLTPERLWYVAQQLKLPPSRVYGVATFYNFFSLKPPGAHTAIVCRGTACYIKDSAASLAAVEERFGIRPGQTTPDGRLSLLIARCFGSCGLAPAAIVDGTVIGHATPDRLIASVDAALAGPRPATAPSAQADERR
jgi:bidirectional [NiFe] hydrogenase diaphorase subunit